jgi:hypothetical protein
MIVLVNVVGVDVAVVVGVVVVVGSVVVVEVVATVVGAYQSSESESTSWAGGWRGRGATA